MAIIKPSRIRTTKIYTMRVTLKKTEKRFAFEASNDKATLAVCASEQLENGNVGFRPMELILEGLAGCMSIDVLSILYKQRQEVQEFRVDVEAKRSNEIPSIFKSIKLHISVVGRVSIDKLEKAIHLSETKYCSVHKILEPTAKISTSYTLKNEA